MSTISENSDFAQQVGLRLRAIRIQQGRSFQDVEALSHGQWKVAAVGSYERASRMISIDRLSALAEFYGVPIRELLPAGQPGPLPPRGVRLVLNLPALANATAPAAAFLRRWVGEIQRERGDYAGLVLSIREGDLPALAMLCAVSIGQLVDTLQQWGLLDDRSSVPRAPEVT